MKYYKILDKQGNIERILSSSATLYNSDFTEITEEEYRQYIPEDTESEAVEDFDTIDEETE